MTSERTPMRKTATRACPICEESRVEALHHQRSVVPDGLMLRGEYDVVCCTRCGFVYADTEDTQVRYDRYYRERSKYADLKTASGGGTSSWDLARLRETASFLAAHLPNQRARIGDFGCANGGLLRCLLDLGCTHLVGIDPAASCAQQAAQSLGIETHVGTLLSVNDVDAFDCIVLSHVLEHVRDLHSAMDTLRRLSRPGAFVYVEVPDASRYDTFVAAPFQEFNLEHINHFSAIAVRNLMRRGGFDLVAEGDRVIESSPGNLYPVIFSLWRLSEPRLSAQDNVQRDEALNERITRYLAASHHLMAEIDAHLQRLRQTHPQIIVWGVGQLALHLLADSALKDFTLAGLVDSNPAVQGMNLAGIPISTPHTIDYASFPILITSLLHQRAITRVIREEMKLANEVLYLREVR